MHLRVAKVWPELPSEEAEQLLRKRGT